MTSEKGLEYATYSSCYITNKASIADDGYLMKIVIDLGMKSFIHAILMVDDMKNGSVYTELLSDEDKESYLQNLEIYIGDDSEIASNNKICPGGPFLDI